LTATTDNAFGRRHPHGAGDGRGTSVTLIVAWPYVWLRYFAFT